MPESVGYSSARLEALRASLKTRLALACACVTLVLTGRPEATESLFADNPPGTAQCALSDAPRFESLKAGGLVFRTPPALLNDGV